MTTSTTNPAYKEALEQLLLQLADDDFIFAYRGSEWLGLAPHIEEDVAFSSISQDTMGHAAMFYELLEEIGAGNANDLAHNRPVQERRNAVLVELVNGPGHYMEDAQYDWAFAVVRNYFYTTAKKVKIDSLKSSTYQPLADVAVKVNMELYYHVMHWKIWFTQLLQSTDEAKERMMAAIEMVSEDVGGLFAFGDLAKQMEEFGLIENEALLQEKWLAALQPVFELVGLQAPTCGMKHGNGRNGEHTEDLQAALVTLSEVYRIDPVVQW
ncbi:1,2-phenylacetyl-CoA epoxidase subunit PaaC [Microbacteriaceae bacterium 4G12]